ncbi:MAG: hypothetical protein D9V44_10365 [Actinobacteria bacterium]|nr:MAG: hypothetical protein D9V44_10365 [Actinomycetota bacterium]
MAQCMLRMTNGIDGVPCDEGMCTYWRVVEHLDLGGIPAEGCAVQHFRLLVDGDSDLAAWLLSVKERVEARERSDRDRTETAR